ncbi:MAG: amino acid ABC transporter substrate-binding protein [Candidatus Dormibacteraeota bacterium]|nr:amino acid ABC transporter substrate-binding protein [Candidatus Dormibacteraeota bacterium]MBV9526601.1 amino acid ABC transporter substrate-binding protein [Candidatus Dormibacteraeota bacterium]
MQQARNLTLALACVAATGAAACGSTGSGSSGSGTILIGLNIPVSADPSVAGVITRGAQLAVDQANARGGVKVGGTTYRLLIKKYDDGGQPQQAAANVDSAIHDGAVAMVEDGIGMRISAAHSQAAGVPEIDITNGDTTLLVNQQMIPYPSLFRLGIPNDAASGLLATYVQSHSQTAALLHDDTDNGRDGAMNMVSNFQTAGVTLSPSQPIEIAADSPTIDAQVQEVKAAAPGAIVLYGTDLFIAKAVTAFHAAGVSTPIYTSQQGESPAVRLLAGAAATEGMKLVTGRMTSEGDATDFPAFEKALAQDHLGPTDAGFKDSEGQEIRQPNDVDFFAYDAVHVIIAALQHQGSANPGRPLLDAMNVVTVKSANGDARGFNSQNHEAFAAQDVYIAGIHDMQFEPVKDEQLSATLPTEDEILSDFPS